MNGKKLILVLVVLGGGVFAASFGLSQYLKAPTPATAEAGPTPPGAAAGAPSTDAPAVPSEAEQGFRIEEKHLYDLVKEVRQKVADCQKREQELAEEEKRLQMSRGLLAKEAQDLETLRLQLTASVTRLKEAQAKSDKSRILIEREEAVNLKRVAAMYDKMDSAAGGRILEGMCTNQQEADAVKILRYMSERSAAKVLAEITDKGVAGRLTEQLKRTREQGETGKS